MSDASEMARAFEYVSDVYKTTATMLLSVDALLDDWIPYNGAWSAIWPARGTNLKSHREWLPTFVLRQYYRREREEQEALTVGAALWGWGERPVPEALCIGSWMRFGDAPDEIYKWALVQRWTSLPPDGTLRTITSTDVDFRGEEKALFERHVVDGRVESVAVPLPTITKSSDVRTAILEPLLAAIPAV
jgi:hypothetical protein